MSEAAEPGTKTRNAAHSRSGDPLALDRQLCFALYSASAMMTRLYRPLLEPLGLTYPQYLAMLALWERSPLMVGEIGTALGLDSATLTPLLKRLEASGYVSRRRDPGDERRVLVAPTQSGTALRQRAAEVREALLCQLPLPVSELGRLHETLDRLNEALKNAPAIDG